MNALIPISEQITEREERLAYHEAVIERGLKSSIEMGFSLAVIKAEKLYEPEFKKFSDYTDARWGVEIKRAQQLIRAAEVVANIKTDTIVSVLPENEAQTRLLAPLPDEEQPAVWELAVSLAEEKHSGSADKLRVTADIVELAVELHKRSKEEESGEEHAQETAEEETSEVVNQFFNATETSVNDESEGEELILSTPEQQQPQPLRIPKFNRTNDNVEWALWTWNPVTGCLHNCPYCYARDIAERFAGQETFPQGFSPMFREERLHAPRFMKVPVAAKENIGEKNVFVCSMADLWGKWVPSEWIDRVLEEVRNAPEWNFLFLTKFPARYEEYAGRLPANAWIGTTVDTQNAVSRAEKAFQRVKDAGYEGIAWLSCEPMLERLTFSSLSMFDWVVVGGASRSTQTPEFKPPIEWTIQLYIQAREANAKFYMKTNMGIDSEIRIREYPQEIPTPKPVAAIAKKNGRFAPPSLLEVSAYMQEIGIPHLSEAWFDHYSANGWKVGRNPMKDWQAACRTWKRNHQANPMSLSKKDERDMTMEDRRQRIRGWLQEGGLNGG